MKLNDRISTYVPRGVATFVALVALLALSFGSYADSSGIPDNGATPDWMMGDFFVPVLRLAWNKPGYQCILTVTPKNLVFTEKPSGWVRTHPYRIAVSKPDFVIVEVQDGKNGVSVSDWQCSDDLLPFLRFDHRNYLTCIEVQVGIIHNNSADAEVEKACSKPSPQAEDLGRGIDLSMYNSLQDAQQIVEDFRTKGGPEFWVRCVKD